MKLSDFDFDLPEGLIATRPARPRRAARLLVAEGGAIHDSTVADLGEWLRAGDRLVLNDTRVIPARLSGIRQRAGGAGARIEVTLLEPQADGAWSALVKPLRKLRDGDKITFTAGLSAVLEARGEGQARLRFNLAGEDFDAALNAAGAMPLPPYIASRRAADAQDREDYQTVWARRPGAVAAPTASLHFDDVVLADLAARGVTFSHVTLHVGAGTFLPVKVEDVTTHKMHAEWGEVSETAAAEIAATRAAGGRIIPVGTTALRLDRDGGARDRRGGAVAGRDRHLHLSRLCLSRDRCADDQLSPAEIDADDAGLGTDGVRAGDGDLRPCHRRAIPILFLWGCFAVDPATER